MGDSPKPKPRSAYAQPGELDTSLLDAESRRSPAAAELKPHRANSTPFTEIPETETASLPPKVPSSYSPQRLTAAPIAESRSSLPPPRVAQDPFCKGPAPVRSVESRPSPPRSSVQDPFYKPLAPAGNVEPSRKTLAPAPGVLGSKPAPLSLGVEPGIIRANPALGKGLAPPPLIITTRSIPLQPMEIDAPIFERKPPPPAVRPRVEPRPPTLNPLPVKSPATTFVRDPLVRRSVSARFELLPDAEPRWNQIGLSAAGQLVLLGLALLSPMIFPQTMQTALKFDVIELMQPVTEIPVQPAPPPPKPAPRPKLKPKVAPKAPELKPEPPKELTEVMPQLSPRQPHVFLNLKPVLPKAHVVEEKAVELKPNLQATEIVLASNGPKAPKEEAKPGNAGGAAPGAGLVSASKVQTGGFGDPNGIGGSANANRRGNINQGGSPGLPGGPGMGNGTGGAQGLRGALASAGSGNGTGTGSAGAGAVTSGVAILYKPNPAYSGEGRTRKIQGDVVLEVVFLASGQLKVTRVVSGLGFGLDDEAIQAAQRIRFTPAKRDGRPVDFPARVRIEFRLVE